MMELARAFNAPTVAILVNGGAIPSNEALQSVRNGWPLLVMQGSGRFADELSAVIRDSQSAKSTELTEIARSNRVTLFHVDDSAKKLKDGEFLPAQIQPYQLGLLPAADLLA